MLQCHRRLHLDVTGVPQRGHWVRCSVMQCVTVCCRALQCVAVCCIVMQCSVGLQCVAVCWSVLQRHKFLHLDVTSVLRQWALGALKCVAVCCSALQCHE